MNLSNAELASKIQHTYIATTATRIEVVRHCRECMEYGFDAAMVGLPKPGRWPRPGAPRSIS